MGREEAEFAVVGRARAGEAACRETRRGDAAHAGPTRMHAFGRRTVAAVLASARSHAERDALRHHKLLARESRELARDERAGESGDDARRMKTDLVHFA